MGRIVRVLIYSIVMISIYLLITTYVNSCQDNSKLAQEDKALSTDYSDENQGNPFPSDSSEIMDIDYEYLDSEVAAIENTKNVESSVVENNSNDKTSDKKANPSATSNMNAGEGGRYLIIAGSYLIEDNALSMMKNLQKVGFKKAEVVIFDNSQYHTVIAGRYNNENTARDMATQLKLKGIESYVKIK